MATKKTETKTTKKTATKKAETKKTETKKVEKNPIPKSEEQLHIYEQQYKEAMEEAKSLIIDVDGELSELEKNNFKDFCDAFQAFRSSIKTWGIVSSTRNTELKSSAYNLVNKTVVSGFLSVVPYPGRCVSGMLLDGNDIPGIASCGIIDGDSCSLGP